jgi:hypothetical protein
MMDTEALAEARQRAQAAFSRARLAEDGRIRVEWEALGRAWLQRLAELERLRPRYPKPRLVA